MYAQHATVKRGLHQSHPPSALHSASARTATPIREKLERGTFILRAWPIITVGSRLMKLCAFAASAAAWISSMLPATPQ
jgi:hypothetical protein